VETDANGGVTQVTARLLTKGTVTRSDEQIAALLEDLGGHLSANGDAHRLVVAADVMKGDELVAIDLLRDLLTAPSFPDSHLAKVTKRQAATIREEAEDPLTIALRRARKEIFAGLPYARTALGTLESVENLNTGHCRELWQNFVQGRNGVLSVFGDVKADEVRQWAEQHLGGIAPGAKSAAGFAPMTAGAQPSRSEIVFNKEQGILVLGFPTVGLAHEDAAVLSLIDEACSDMGSRLFNRIREQMGLAYFVGAQSFHALGAGAFYFYVGTDPKKLDLVESELRNEIADLATNGLRDEELTRAKVSWKSSWLRQQQGNGAMADALGWEELNGHGFGHHARLPAIMEAVDAGRVLAAARRYLDPSGAFTVRVHP
jgi:zinc protease